MITKRQYIEYLISTAVNYTCSHLAEHLEGVSHDAVTDYLQQELKQLTSSEKCECRKARSQRNHLACCYLAWLSLKVKAEQWGKTLYSAQHDLLSDYLPAELRNPRIPALYPV